MTRPAFELRWRTQAGGGGRTGRRYLDFVVDGASLQDLLRAGGQVTPLGCWSAEAERESIRQLLCRAPASSQSGRVPIYVCAECGDLGCGAVTVAVERTPEGFVWRDFAYENASDPAMIDLDSFGGTGPFLFDKTAYWQVLNERASGLPRP